MDFGIVVCFECTSLKDPVTRPSARRDAPSFIQIDTRHIPGSATTGRPAVGDIPIALQADANRPGSRTTIAFLRGIIRFSSPHEDTIRLVVNIDIPDILASSSRVTESRTP